MFSADLTQKTIAAVITAVAPGQGGVAIIRISGPLAEDIGKALVVVPGTQTWASHRVLYGHVIDPATKERIDEVLLLIMKAPRTFTGEDVVEIHCHGGVIIVERVLELVLAFTDVRRALPGEFSQRALLNGKRDLSSAESINELINARSCKAAQIAMAGLDGGIQQCISSLRSRLIDQLSELDARVDFEEDLPSLDATKLVNELKSVQSDLLQLIERKNPHLS